MDGTMINNMMVHHRAWKRKLEQLGLNMSLDEVHQKVHGVNIEILERLFGDRFTQEERRRISSEKEAEYRKIFEPELVLLNGLSELLHDLRKQNIPMGVGSAAPPENVDFVLNKLDLWRYFKTVRHSAHVSNGKPHPEIYLKVAEDLNTKPENCLVFEDTPAGAESARRAGCSVIVVTTTHHPDEFKENDNVLAFINDFTEITTEQVLSCQRASA